MKGVGNNNFKLARRNTDTSNSAGFEQMDSTLFEKQLLYDDDCFNTSKISLVPIG